MSLKIEKPKRATEVGRCRVYRMSENTESIYTAGFAGQGVLNKDHKVWLDGPLPPLKSTSKNVIVKL
jgi:hypothetical protein